MARTTAAMVSLVVLMGTVGAWAEDSLGLDVTTDFYSKYIWRGQNYSDDWVWQPGASMTFGGLTVGIWGNMDMTTTNEPSGSGVTKQWEFTELDYYADYSFDLTEDIGMSLGYIYYEFPEVGADTQELYWGLSFDTLFSPSVTVYHDIDEAEGTYISAGISHSVESIGEIWEGTPVGMEIGLSVGWGDSDYNEYYWGSAVDGSEMNDLAISVSFPMEIGGWSVAPSLNYVTLLDSDIRKNNGYDSSDDFFFTGISIGTTF